MQLNLEGKVGLVAAGSQGIGRGVALAFAREGMRVAICARGRTALEAALTEIEDDGAQGVAVEADVTKPSDVSATIERTVERFGGIDVLVTNAGGPPAKTFEETTDEDWQSSFELNLLSAVRLIRASLPYLGEAAGSIVTIGSISMKQPVQGLILSNSIRPGVIGLAKSLSEELSDRGIRINNVLPGFIMTERSRELADARARRSEMSVQDVLSETEKSIPLGRYGTPEEVANLVVFLASSAASYINGVTVLCDGGLYKGLM